MKKAKIMLTAIAVFAVIGGALAFKARQLNTFYSTAPNGQCSATFRTTYTTAEVGEPLTFTTRLSTTTTTAACPILTVKTVI